MQSPSFLKKALLGAFVFYFSAMPVFRAFANENSQATDVNNAEPQSQQVSENEAANTPNDSSAQNDSSAEEPNVEEVESDQNAEAEEPMISPTTLVEEPNYDQSQEFAEQRLQLDSASNTGALAYEYPIILPPGRNGMQPSVSLSYNSQQTSLDSLIAHGWDLPIPSIERLPKKGIDVLYTGTEPFFSSSMTGELVPLNLTGPEEGEYGSEYESTGRLSYEFSNNTWVARDGEGNTYYFGTNAGSRQDDPADASRVARWMLECMEDANGNYISYSYAKLDGQIYPAEIRYTGFANSLGNFRIEFGYQDRTDETVFYNKDFEVITSKQIETITTYIQNDWVREYTLEYATGDNGYRSLLAAIHERARGEDDSILEPNATTFDYSELVDSWSWVEDTGYNLPLTAFSRSNESDTGARIVDVNGDGFDDIIGGDGFTAPYDASDRDVYLNNGDGSGWTLTPAMRLPRSVLRDRVHTVVKFMDVNGDIYPDLVHSTIKYDLSDLYTHITRVWLNNGDETGWTEVFDVDVDFSFITRHGSTPTAEPYSVTTLQGDVDGDGLSDVLGGYLDPDTIDDSVPAPTYRQIYIHEDDASVFGVSAPYRLPFVINGSGDRDSYVRAIDVNGDGLIDLVSSVSHTPEGPGIWMNKGPSRGFEFEGSFDIPVSFNISGGGARYVGGQVADMNADGLTDLFYSYATDYFGQDQEKLLALNRGNHTGWEEDALASPELPLLSKSSNRDLGVRTGDFNGDGLTDFIRIEETDHEGTAPRIFIADGVVPDLLTSITHSTGAGHEVEYAPSTSYREADGSLSNPRMQSVVQTVASITSNDGMGNAWTRSFHYSGGEMHVADKFNRRPKGFREVLVTDAEGNVEVRNYYHNEEGLFGRVRSAEYYGASGNLLRVDQIIWESTDMADGRQFIYKSDDIEQAFDGEITSRDRAIHYEYDIATGNILEEQYLGEVDADSAGNYTDIGSDRHDISYTYVTTPHFENLVATEEHSASSVLQSASKHYYDNLPLAQASNGNPTRIEEYVDAVTGYVMTAEADYNLYGLPTHSRDALLNETRYEYDNWMLFPRRIINALGHVEEMTRDYSSGAEKTRVDANGYTSETTFDALDRPIRFEGSHPDGASQVLLETWEYQDAILPFSAESKKYLSDTVSVQSIEYVDGFGRTIQSRTEAEVSNLYTVQDKHYDYAGRLQIESLPYYQVGEAYSGITSESHLLVENTYDALSRKLTITNALGTESSTHLHWEEEQTDRNGNIKQYVTDAFDRLIAVREQLNSQWLETTYTYDSRGNLVRITDANGNTRAITYDGLSRRIELEDLHHPSDASFGIWQYAYDNEGNVASIITPAGDVVQYAFDALNRQVEENLLSNPGIEKRYTYDNCHNGIGRMCSAVNNGSPQVTTNYGYDAHGNQTMHQRQIGPAVFNTLSEFGYAQNLTDITYPDGATSETVYNNAGLPEALNSSDGPVVLNVDYSPLGQVERIEYANGAVTTKAYDANQLYFLESMLTKIDGKRVQDITYEYDAVGNITRIAERANTAGTKVVEYDYDELHRLLESRLYEGSVRHLPEHEIEEDTVALWRFDGPDGSGEKEENAANPDILRVNIYSAAGSSTGFNQEVDGSMTTGISSGQNAVNYHESLDVEEFTIEAWAKFNNDHRYQVILSRGGWRGNYSIYYDGNRGELRFQISSSLGDRFVSMPYIAAQGNEWMYVAMTYDGSDMNAYVNGNHIGSIDAPDFSPNGELRIGDAHGGWTDDVDFIGRLDEIVFTSRAKHSEEIANYYADAWGMPEYDASQLGALLQTESFTYDAIGNILSSPAGSYTYSAAGNATPHAVTDIDGETYTYDANGNLSAVGSRYTLDWSYDNKIKEITQNIAGTPSVTSYLYDHQGDRVRVSAGGQDVYYPNQYFEGNGSEQKRNYYLGGTYIGNATVSSGVSEMHFGHSDHLGGGNVVTNDDGDMAQVLDYDAYGSVRVSDSPSGYDETQKFTGYELDDNSFYYAGARYYLSDIGRFVSQDPVSLALGSPELSELTKLDLETLLTNPQALNAYSYTINNPIKYIDENGEFFDIAVDVGFTLYSGFKFGQALVRGESVKEEGINLLLDVGGLVVPGVAGLGSARRAVNAVKAVDNVSEVKGGTYKLIDKVKETVVRTGRSSDLKSRQQKHLRNPETKDYKFEVDRYTDNYDEQRGREQIIYDLYPESWKVNGGLNKIKPISDKNPKRDQYMEAGRRL